jgi:hypothetical protein
VQHSKNVETAALLTVATLRVLALAPGSDDWRWVSTVPVFEGVSHTESARLGGRRYKWGNCRPSDRVSDADENFTISKRIS